MHGNRLIAIQNGVRPHRIVTATLDGAHARIERVDLLEANLPSFDEPTLGAVVGGAFFYVATSQWGHFDDAGQLPDKEALRGPIIRKIDLND